MGHDQKISKKVFSLFLGSPCRETPKNAIKTFLEKIKKKKSQLVTFLRSDPANARCFSFIFFSPPLGCRPWGSLGIPPTRPQSVDSILKAASPNLISSHNQRKSERRGDGGLCLSRPPSSPSLGPHHGPCQRSHWCDGETT